MSANEGFGAAEGGSGVGETRGKRIRSREGFGAVGGVGSEELLVTGGGVLG